MKVLYVTTFKPESENNGQPSILSKLIYEGLLEKHGRNLDFELVCMPKRFVSRKLYQLLFSVGIEFLSNIDSYDYIYIYPYWCLNYIPSEYHSKVRVIGPDLQSTLFSRMSKVQSSIIKKVALNFIGKMLKIREMRLSKVDRVYFVGQTDVIDFTLNTGGGNAEYIPHPMIDTSNDNINEFCMNKKNMILISGAGGVKYYGKLLNEYLRALSILAPDTNIIVTGKENEEIVNNYTEILKNLNYIGFVENYDGLFTDNKIVHVSPLIVGCGTKNRILDALTRKAICVTTEVGSENLHELFGTGSIKVSSSPHEMAELSISAFEEEVNWKHVESLLSDRNLRFQRQLIK